MPAWSLDGPSGTHRSGTGATTIGSLPAGAYTATWGALNGYLAPLPSSGDLVAGTTLTLTGVYAPLAPGTIHITCNGVAGPWRLEWDGGSGFLTGTGSQALAARPAGDYTIVWLALDGWFTPSPTSQAFTLPASGEATVTGTWSQMPPGTVQVDPNPDSVNAPWILLGPSGYQRMGNGDVAVSSLPAGEYSVQWGAVIGWTSPQPSLVAGTLAAGGALAFHGTYIEVPPVTIGVDVTPNDMTAAWHLSGPGGFSLTQAGDWSQAGLPAGQYSIQWGDGGTDWSTPSPATLAQTVAAGGSFTFSGTYTAIPRVTVSVDVSPNSVPATWTVTGPDGYTHTQGGDWTQTGLLAGQYSIQWGSAGTDWTMPSPDVVSQVVDPGADFTFAGTYAAVTRIGLFTTNDGAALSSAATWSWANEAWAYILIYNPDPSGVAYWDMKFTFTGANTVANDLTLIAGTDAVPYLDTFRVTLPAGAPLLPMARNVAYVGAVKFYCGSRSASSVYLNPVNMIGYTPPTPMYAPGCSPASLIQLLPYNGSWDSPAFTISP
jgi:hypothetical protein